MTPDEAMKLAHTFAETARAEEEGRAAAVEATTAYPIRSSDANGLSTPTFLHERELADALRIITLLASGRNPFGEDSLERLSHGQRTELLRSLSIVVCTLIGAPEPTPSPQIDMPADSANPESKRPLEQYLERMEKQAILEALAEAGNNQAKAARLLGINYRSLRYRMEGLKIDV